MEYCSYDTAFEISPVTKKEEKRKKKEKKVLINTSPVESGYDSYNPQDSYASIIESFANDPINIPTVAKNPEVKKELPAHFLANDEGFTDTPTNNSSLPLPSLSDSWKPLTPSKSETAFFDSLPTPGGTYPVWNVNQNDIMIQQGKHIKKQEDMVNYSSLLKRIEELENRLKDLDYSNKEENKKEILLFVGTGLAMILALNILTK